MKAAESQIAILWNNPFSCNMLVGQCQVIFFHLSLGWMLQTPCWHFSSQAISWKKFQVVECPGVFIKSQRPPVIWCTHQAYRCIIISTISMRCVLACIYKHRQTLWMESLESLFHCSNIVRQMLKMLHMTGPRGRVSHFLNLKSLLKKTIRNYWHARFWLRGENKHRQTLWMENFESLVHCNSIVRDPCSSAPNSRCFRN